MDEDDQPAPPSPSEEHVLASPLNPPQCVISTQSSPTPEHVPTLPPALTPPEILASDPMRELLTNDQQCFTAVNKSLSPSKGHISTSPPAPPDKPLSDYTQGSFMGDRQCVNATSTASSSTQEHIPTSKSSDKLHPTLSCWIKNMNKLSSLIDRLHELASAAPAEHRSQLLKRVVTLRATSKEQKERFMEFLQLSEEYANKYLLDISAEIQQQSTVLDNLEERLEAARKLHGEAVDLHMFYESGTVATMKDLRATGKAVPCCLPKQITETFDFQDFRGHFHRTMPYSARWTSCWPRFGDFTKH
jgi:hypothetical protein